MGLAVWFAAHVYVAVFGVLFLSALGLPLPAMLTLLLAGAAARAGSVGAGAVFACAVVAESTGSLLLYAGGRLTGWWLLAKLCRISFDPERCIFRSADFFYAQGARTLLFARFVPGLNSMAQPLAGSLNMRVWRFWRYDFAGAVLHVAAWMAVGYFLSSYIRAVTSALAVVGHVVLLLTLVAVAVYAGAWLLSHLRSRKFRGVPRIGAAAVAERLQNPDPARPVVIADVRSHGYYDPGMQRIKNSIRVEPNRLVAEMDALRETLAPECEIYVYCSCLRDATSVRIAHALGQNGHNVRVLQGGLRSWLKAGWPTEPVPAEDMRHLPRFE